MNPEQDTYRKAWALAKSLQAQVSILEIALVEIATSEIPNNNDDEHDLLQDLIETAQDALHNLKTHRET